MLLNMRLKGFVGPETICKRKIVVEAYRVSPMFYNAKQLHYLKRNCDEYALTNCLSPEIYVYLIIYWFTLYIVTY